MGWNYKIMGLINININMYNKYKLIYEIDLSGNEYTGNVQFIVLDGEKEQKKIIVKAIETATFSTEECPRVKNKLSANDLFYGEQLGTIVETQASQLWLVVARGSVESMPALSMGSAEASLFSEIKTGGNGEEVRKSNVEHKNIISLPLFFLSCSGPIPLPRVKKSVR